MGTIAKQVPLSESVSLFLSISTYQYHLRTLLIFARLMSPCLGPISIVSERRIIETSPDYNSSHSFVQKPRCITPKWETAKCKQTREKLPPSTQVDSTWLSYKTLYPWQHRKRTFLLLLWEEQRLTFCFGFKHLSPTVKEELFKKQSKGI